MDPILEELKEPCYVVDVCLGLALFWPILRLEVIFRLVCGPFQVIGVLQASIVIQEGLE
jgi:hypothetical protein